MCEDSAHCQDFRFDDIVLFGAVSSPTVPPLVVHILSATNITISQDGKVGEMDCTGLEGVTGMGIPCTNGTLPNQS